MKAQLSSNRNWSRWNKNAQQGGAARGFASFEETQYSHSMRFLRGCAQKAAVVPKHLPFSISNNRP